MKNRSVLAVLLLTFFTFGIYGLVWFISTKIEMTEKFGAQIPTAILLFIPFVNIYWMWKWSEGVELATEGRMSGAVAFLMVFVLGFIGMAIVQAKFNEGRGDAPIPSARVAA